MKLFAVQYRSVTQLPQGDKAEKTLYWHSQTKTKSEVTMRQTD